MSTARQLPKRKTAIPVPSGMKLTEAGTLEYINPQTTPNTPK